MLCLVRCLDSVCLLFRCCICFVCVWLIWRCLLGLMVVLLLQLSCCAFVWGFCLFLELLFPGVCLGFSGIVVCLLGYFGVACWLCLLAVCLFVVLIVRWLLIVYLSFDLVLFDTCLLRVGWLWWLVLFGMFCWCWGEVRVNVICFVVFALVWLCCAFALFDCCLGIWFCVLFIGCLLYLLVTLFVW